MKRVFWLFLILVGLVACGNDPLTKTPREGEPDIYSMWSEDAEMNKAISTARLTLGTFNNALLSNKFDIWACALKVRFPIIDGFEHIWVDSIKMHDDQYLGIVGNRPDKIIELKIGDKIEINKDDITDWMFIEGGVLRGGYTIKSIRNRMTREERMEFDEEVPFRIVD